MIGLFKRKNKIKKELINFSHMDLSSYDICRYVIYLYEKYNFSHIGWDYQCSRVYLYTLPGNDKAIQYFKERCPGLIEDTIIYLREADVLDKYNDTMTKYSHFKWNNGFIEYKKDGGTKLCLH